MPDVGGVAAMNIQTRVERLEQASGINKRCPFCALAVPMPPDFKPEDYCAGKCPMCGVAANIDMSRMTTREREVCAELKYYPFAGALTNVRGRATSCWLVRRQEERGDEAAERRRLEVRASFDPLARKRLKLMDEVDARFSAMWEEYLAGASDETLQGIIDIHALTDEELERIIWPEASTVAE